MILPEAKDALPLLAALLDEHTEPRPARGQPRAEDAVVPRISIFGHGDPVGDDDLNKRLSGRRAAAVYGLLTRTVEVWEDLYSNKQRFASSCAGDDWGIRSLQLMLNELPADTAEDDATERSATASATDHDADGFPRGLDPTEDLGDGSAEDPEAEQRKLLDQPLAVTGVLDEPTKAAVKRFQESARGQAAGLASDGVPGPATRGELFLAYMETICVDKDGLPFRVDSSAGFLGRHQDAGGKADWQGCSEFNPLMVFSQNERADFEVSKDKTARNAANSINRRVLVLVFRPGVQAPETWPCPRANEGVGGCKKRFWSDGEKRRSSSSARREFADTRDTFACRFYQRLTTTSPCERAVSGPRVLVTLKLHDIFYQPCRNQVFTATGEGGYFERGRTDDDGMYTIKIPAALNEVVVRYVHEAGHEYSVIAQPVQSERRDDEALLAHITNFGFGRGQGRGVAKFQAARDDLALTA
ncbi:MAG TPA: peptidoglycan-binding protein, partial [Gammaproteobacteria bacterium]